jgi:hypothetical protein
MATITVNLQDDKSAEKPHRFLGFYRRVIDGTAYFVYRCVCGYVEGVPVVGGPSRSLDQQFRPRRDARNIAAHCELERAHEVN